MSELKCELSELKCELSELKCELSELKNYTFKRSQSVPVFEKTTLGEFLDSYPEIEDYYIVNKDETTKKIFIKFCSYSQSTLDELCENIPKSDMKIDIEVIQKSFYK